MKLIAWAEIFACYVAWWYPFLFRAPHRQRRTSITVVTPTRVGLLLETAAIFLSWLMRVPDAPRSDVPHLLLAAGFGAVAVILAFTSVTHLGRQFRIHAGLYHDHELVRTGPYAVVRHPIYAALLALLVFTLVLLTPWQWALVSLAVYICGTEIRVRTEDGLLAGRFGEEFTKYRKAVPAYIPFVR
jgi:protein-S-isoprenylcysteine O-methyltransferase Ste14